MDELLRLLGMAGIGFLIGLGLGYTWAKHPEPGDTFTRPPAPTRPPTHRVVRTTEEWHDRDDYKDPNY